MPYHTLKQTYALATVELALRLGWKLHTPNARKHFYFYGAEASGLVKFEVHHLHPYDESLPSYTVGNQTTTLASQAMNWLEEAARKGLAYCQCGKGAGNNSRMLEKGAEVAG